MNKDTSGAVGWAGTARGTVVQENDAGLVGAGPYPYPEAGRAGDRAGQPHPARRHRGPGRRSGPQWTAEARSVRASGDPTGGSLQAAVIRPAINAVMLIRFSPLRSGLSH
jgi:hypothetical protein